MSPAFKDTLRNRINRASAALRMQPTFFEPFLNQLFSEPELFTYTSIQAGVLNDILDNQISQGQGDVSVLTTVTPAVPAGFDTLLTRLKRSPEITVYSGPRLVSRVIALITGELKRIGGIALLIVTTILLLLTRRIKHIALLLAPLLLSMLWTFGILGWAGVPLNLINTMVAVFIFGLVIDYCIFLYHGFTGMHRSEFTHISGGAILISALTTGCGMGALIFAKHPVLHSLGSAALIGIISGVLAVFIIIPLAFQKHS
jgi:predicted exporter